MSCLENLTPRFEFETASLEGLKFVQHSEPVEHSQTTDVSIESSQVIHAPSSSSLHLAVLKPDWEMGVGGGTVGGGTGKPISGICPWPDR